MTAGIKQVDGRDPWWTIRGSGTFFGQRLLTEATLFRRKMRQTPICERLPRALCRPFLIDAVEPLFLLLSDGFKDGIMLLCDLKEQSI